MTMVDAGRALKRLLIGYHLRRETRWWHYHFANISLRPTFQDACRGALLLRVHLQGLHIGEEHLLAVRDSDIHGGAHFLNRRLHVHVVCHVSSGIQVIDTAVIGRQHDISERVTKDAGEFPIEVDKDIELHRATTITKELSNGCLESPHVELDHGVMGEEKERSSRVARSEQVRSSEGSCSRISSEGDQSSPWDSKKESILRRTWGRRCPSSQSYRKAISTFSDPAPSSGRYTILDKSIGMNGISHSWISYGKRLPY
jgi:hypothetical protein